MFIDFSEISILIVEDVAPMRQLLADIINALGIRTIYTASNGREGYGEYAAKRPDIIITDWHMPVMDGLQFIDMVRKAPDSPRRNIPIIMVTGLSAPPRITKARDFGVTEYLVKPFTVQDLAKRISYTINKPRDFILTPEFAGPDRRRKESDDFEGGIKRKRETDKKIKAQRDLQRKAGKGQINPVYVAQSQKVMEETNVDFVPIAQSFLNDLKEAIEAAENTFPPTKKIKEDITFSIMQLKANARIFKYDLIGELSSTTLNFLEVAPNIDDLILEILNAQYSTISHLVNTNAHGDGGEEGEALKEELTQAYKRYNRAKALRQQKTLLAKSKKTKSD